ncbi:MAG: 16S rRNA (guanine(527)-N(7))-methyltransferase RsmG [Hydrogenothermaceae bacterium]|nr:16S rRNA (guanine(527)-N(7))-methyltransferase RsmG [Hydrogenothermaceae bacterium]
MIETLLKLCRDNSIEIDQQKIRLFEIYLELLLKWNKVYNLTSIRKKEEIITKHFFDSLTLVKLFKFIELNVKGKEVADFGTGAGFPGIPLKIYYPQTNLSLIESVGKKCIFLETLRRELELDYRVLCKRAEDISDKFDVVLSRATGETFEVLKVGENLLKPGGKMIIMKGRDVEEELREFTITLSFRGFPDRKFIIISKR